MMPITPSSPQSNASPSPQRAPLLFSWLDGLFGYQKKARVLLQHALSQWPVKKHPYLRKAIAPFQSSRALYTHLMQFPDKQHLLLQALDLNLQEPLKIVNTHPKNSQAWEKIEEAAEIRLPLHLSAEDIALIHTLESYVEELLPLTKLHSKQIEALRLQGKRRIRKLASAFHRLQSVLRSFCDVETKLLVFGVIHQTQELPLSKKIQETEPSAFKNTLFKAVLETTDREGTPALTFALEQNASLELFTYLATLTHNVYPLQKKHFIKKFPAFPSKLPLSSRTYALLHHVLQQPTFCSLFFKALASQKGARLSLWLEHTHIQDPKIFEQELSTQVIALTASLYFQETLPLIAQNTAYQTLFLPLEACIPPCAQQQQARCRLAMLLPEAGRLAPFLKTLSPAEQKLVLLGLSYESRETVSCYLRRATDPSALFCIIALTEDPTTKSSLAYRALAGTLPKDLCAILKPLFLMQKIAHPLLQEILHNKDNPLLPHLDLPALLPYAEKILPLLESLNSAQQQLVCLILGRSPPEPLSTLFTQKVTLQKITPWMHSLNTEEQQLLSFGLVHQKEGRLSALIDNKSALLKTKLFEALRQTIDPHLFPLIQNSPKIRDTLIKHKIIYQEGSL